MSAFTGVSLSKAGTSSPIKIDLSQQPFWGFSPGYGLGLIATVAAASNLTYKIQVTADQLPVDGGNWNDADDLTALTASKNSNITYPVTGVRLVVTSWTAGSVNLGVAKWP